MSDVIRELIVYACPRGSLAEQIHAFYAASRNRFGSNTAHTYPPHITLTGFFHDEPGSIRGYCAALAAAHTQMLREQPMTEIAITELRLRAEFHGLLISSCWLEELTAIFATRAVSPTRRDAIRCKRNLHLSLAYGFPADQGPGLAVLARELVDPAAPVQWVLGLYERRNDEWITHCEWDTARA
ncbi:MAG: hypothetical protein HC822_18795 [Oscillochloris sp.]|nr:hypothetical protein [Oscillochloris sp.]